jgi:iron complex transport system ATP-binding protein
MSPAPMSTVTPGAMPGRSAHAISGVTTGVTTSVTTSARLQARGLTLDLGGRRVVDDVSLTLCGGESVAIVGPNGAGKSTLLGLLAGLQRPGAGMVALDGRPLPDWPARERAVRLAWLAQQGEASGELAARDVVMLGRLPRLGLLGSPGPADDAVVAAAMAETECTALAQRRLSALSGGERQRVLLARLLAVQAPLLLLDEPTTHLDPPHQLALMRSLLGRARAGVAVAAVLHDLTLALMCDRLLVLEAGRLVADGAPADPAVQARLVSVFRHAFAIVPNPQSEVAGASFAATTPAAAGSMTTPAPTPAPTPATTACRWLVVPQLAWGVPPSPWPPSSPCVPADGPPMRPPSAG